MLGIDVRLAQAPGPWALSGLAGPGINLARRDFLDVFAPEMSCELKLGHVSSAGEEPYEQYATYISGRPLLLRGGAKSKAWTCDLCGTMRYIPDMDWYVMRDMLSGQDLYECHFGGLIITERLRMRIEKGRWKGIYISSVPIADTAKDGIEIPPSARYW